MRAPVVLKFGSSVLRGPRDCATAASEIYRFVRRGHPVVAVVSAIGGTTDWLVRASRGITPEPAPDGLAALLCTGERASGALLRLALDAAGIPATLLDPVEVGLRTDGPPLDAEPVLLDVLRVRRALERDGVVVLPGFFGVGPDGGPALLGRGGSDLTAVFAAVALGAAHCRLLKDVGGVFEADPAARGGARVDGACDPAPPGGSPDAPGPRRFSRLAWEDAEALGARVVQPRALRLAREHGLPVHVAAPGASSGTVIDPGPSRLVVPRPAPPPLRVALLGHGTVGAGVHRRLAAMPDRFQLTAIAVRDLERHLGAGGRAEPISGGPPGDPNDLAGLLTDDPFAAARSADVVVEVMGGEEPAARIVAESLAAGRHVVTDNERVLASHGPALEERSAASGAELRYSAAVGGAVPVLERIRRLRGYREIRAVHAVLSGTTNFILDRLHEGASLASAVAQARRTGFAEADPGRDLDGSDAAQKLMLVARVAFPQVTEGLSLAESASDGGPRILVSGIEGLGPEEAAQAEASGRVLRLVATLERTETGLAAHVRPRALPRKHFLAGARKEENRVVIRDDRGDTIRLSGKGAGGWPTAEAVVADLLDLRRALVRHRRLLAGEGPGGELAAGAYRALPRS